MRKFRYGLVLSALLLSAPAFAANRAIQVDINGIGPGVDAYALKTVRQVLGLAVTNGLLDHFNVNGRGIEGGISACAEVAASNTKGTGLPALARQLRGIRPDPSTTAYSVKLLESCDSNIVFCPAIAIACPDGSYVTPQPPTCAIPACPVPGPVTN